MRWRSGSPMCVPGSMPRPLGGPTGRRTSSLSLPEGAHLRLDPSLDLAALHLPRLTLMTRRSGTALRDRCEGSHRECDLLCSGPCTHRDRTVWWSAGLFRREDAGATPGFLPMESPAAPQDGTARHPMTPPLPPERSPSAPMPRRTSMPNSRAERQLILLSAGTAVRRLGLREEAGRLLGEVDWSRLTETLRQRRLLPTLGPRIVELAQGRASEDFAAAWSRR